MPFNSALIFDDLELPDGHTENFKTHVRCLFKKAGIRELSYVEHFNSGSPMWVMLVDNPSGIDLKPGVYVCRAATWQRAIKKTFRETRYPKRWLDPIFRLLVPHYPNCDFSIPLGQLIASGNPNETGGRCDD